MRRSGALTARTALGHFREKEWLEFFGLSSLPTSNPEYPKMIVEDVAWLYQLLSSVLSANPTIVCWRPT